MGHTDHKIQRKIKEALLAHLNPKPENRTHLDLLEEDIGEYEKKWQVEEAARLHFGEELHAQAMQHQPELPSLLQNLAEHKAAWEDLKLHDWYPDFAREHAGELGTLYVDIRHGKTPCPPLDHLPEELEARKLHVAAMEERLHSTRKRTDDAIQALHEKIQGTPLEEHLADATADKYDALQAAHPDLVDKYKHKPEPVRPPGGGNHPHPLETPAGFWENWKGRGLGVTMGKFATVAAGAGLVADGVRRIAGKSTDEKPMTWKERTVGAVEAAAGIGAAVWGHKM